MSTVKQKVNLQLAMKRTEDPEGNLEVFKVWETFQGEGPFVGEPAVFVRLYGCNLQCKFCDTDYTSGYVEVSPASLVEWVGQFRKSGLVVITGGEPLRQNIGEFIRQLIQKESGYRVQIETNGTLWQDIPYLATTIVCSPKTPKINEDLKPRIHHLKYILSADAVDEKDGLPISVLGDDRAPAKPWAGFKGRIYVQPQDDYDESKNRANLEAARASCLKHGYILSIQTHKLIGVE